MTYNAFFVSRVVLSLWVAIAIAFIGLLIVNAPGFSVDGMAADASSISGPAFLRWGELALLRLSAGLAVALGVSAAAFTWCHLGRVTRGLAGLASGMGVYFIATLFLGRVLYTTAEVYGLTPEDWNTLVKLLSLILGIAVAITNGQFLKHESSLLRRILASLLICVGTFGLCWLSWHLLLVFSLNSSDSAAPLLTTITIALPIAVAILAAVWASFPTRRSLQRLLTLNNSVGTIGLTFYGLVYLLLNLGYAD